MSAGASPGFVRRSELYCLRDCHAAENSADACVSPTNCRNIAHRKRIRAGRVRRMDSLKSAVFLVGRWQLGKKTQPFPSAILKTRPAPAGKDQESHICGIFFSLIVKQCQRIPSNMNTRTHPLHLNRKYYQLKNRRNLPRVGSQKRISAEVHAEHCRRSDF